LAETVERNRLYRSRRQGKIGQRLAVANPNFSISSSGSYFSPAVACTPVRPDLRNQDAGQHARFPD